MGTSYCCNTPELPDLMSSISLSIVSSALYLHRSNLTPTGILSCRHVLTIFFVPFRGGGDTPLWSSRGGDDKHSKFSLFNFVEVTKVYFVHLVEVAMLQTMSFVDVTKHTTAVSVEVNKIHKRGFLGFGIPTLWTKCVIAY